MHHFQQQFRHEFKQWLLGKHPKDILVLLKRDEQIYHRAQERFRIIA